MRDVRLGDDIDDYCVRCKRVMNHAVVSVMNNAPAKVRCRTCHSDHDFRHEQAPPPKVDARKAALFSEVLKKVDPSAAAEPVEPVELEEAALETVEIGEAETADVAEVAEVAEEAEVAEAVEAPAPKVKKARAKK
jgi:hypothetical protein